MCFSPTASFMASAGLATLGIATITIAKKNDKILAAIPLLFAVQQGIEGIQWIALQNGDVNVVAGYAFLFFALLVWPIYVPFTIFKLDDSRHSILKWFVALGIVLSLLFLWILISTPLVVEVVNKCIVYRADFYRSVVVTIALIYIIIIGVPFLISSKSFIRWLGFLAVFSAFIAGIFFFSAFISVWCFFAAILSSLIFFYVYRHK